MRYKVYYEQRDNDYYKVVEADSIKQARGRFACGAVKNEIFGSFIKAIKAIREVEEIMEYGTRCRTDALNMRVKTDV